MILREAMPHAGGLPRRGRISGLLLVRYGGFRILLETVRNPGLVMSSFAEG